MPPANPLLIINRTHVSNRLLSCPLPHRLAVMKIVSVTGDSISEKVNLRAGAKRANLNYSVVDVKWNPDPCEGMSDFAVPSPHDTGCVACCFCGHREGCGYA